MMWQANAPVDCYKVCRAVAAAQAVKRVWVLGVYLFTISCRLPSAFISRYLFIQLLDKWLPLVPGEVKAVFSFSNGWPKRNMSCDNVRSLWIVHWATNLLVIMQLTLPNIKPSSCADIEWKSWCLILPEANMFSNVGYVYPRMVPASFKPLFSIVLSALILRNPPLRKVRISAEITTGSVQ